MLIVVLVRSVYGLQKMQKKFEEWISFLNPLQMRKKMLQNHGFKHAKYYNGTAEEWLSKWAKQGYIPDVVTVDPPRTGLAPSFIKTVLKIKPKRFVYTSCNPSTFARDLKELSKIIQSGIYPTN